MKKFIKIMIIVVLVLAVIGGTCYFFFQKHDEKDNTTESFATFLNSESNEKFKNNLSNISDLVNSDSTDARFEIIMETNKKLETILSVLTSYHVENETQINDEKVAQRLQVVKGKKSTILSMMAEYEKKATSSWFKRHLGANDLYIKSCEYLVETAKLSNLINNNLNVNKNVDVKFNVFEIYCNVVINTFSDVNTENKSTSNVVILDPSNINLLNDSLTISNSFVQTGVYSFAIQFNKFNEAYASCDKNAFALNMKENIESVTTVEQETKEKIATYYFKLILGL